MKRNMKKMETRSEVIRKPLVKIKKLSSLLKLKKVRNKQLDNKLASINTKRSKRYEHIPEMEISQTKKEQYNNGNEMQRNKSEILGKTATGLAESLNLISRFSVKAQQKRRIIRTVSSDNLRDYITNPKVELYLNKMKNETKVIEYQSKVKEALQRRNMDQIISSGKGNIVK
jgi:hypothetical protein